ncbi:MAG TPA: hypothetical protein PLO13_07235 [Anaerolineaceae bacterium]|nr:hypothetical protein [Anaerolineaceae bacterium]HQJ33135.1 hypothetical protein [Anaerolineaceae bacterium]
MEEIGGAFGELGLLCIIFLVLRPILQAVVESLRKRGKTLPNWLKKTSQFVTKNHRYAGIVALVAIAVHFILQYLNYNVVPVAGLIAFLLLAVQTVLGFGLTRQKDKERRKKMALGHRVLGIAIVVAVIIHRL